MAEHDDLWIFGYGSLMWRPGFDYVDVKRARLVGFQRAFCIYSTHHRGSEARPGLVLGLDRGGTCTGLAYCVAAARRDETIAYLRAREQISGVYRETYVPIELEGAGEAQAITYIVERAHPSYAPHLTFAKQVAIIRGARGLSGPNAEYLVNTNAHLREIHIRDRNLERLAVAVGGLFSAADGDGETRYRRAMMLARISPGMATGAPRLKRGERRRFLHRMELGQ